MDHRRRASKLPAGINTVGTDMGLESFYRLPNGFKKGGLGPLLNHPGPHLDALRQNRAISLGGDLLKSTLCCTRYHGLLSQFRFGILTPAV